MRANRLLSHRFSSSFSWLAPAGAAVDWGHFTGAVWNGHSFGCRLHTGLEEWPRLRCDLKSERPKSRSSVPARAIKPIALRFPPHDEFSRPGQKCGMRTDADQGQL